MERWKNVIKTKRNQYFHHVYIHIISSYYFYCILFLCRSTRVSDLKKKKKFAIFLTNLGYFKAAGSINGISFAELDLLVRLENTVQF